MELKAVTPIIFDNISGECPEGFQSATFNNLGMADATITQNGKTWSLPTGQIYTFAARQDLNPWLAVTCNAVGTKVECTWY